MSSKTSFLVKSWGLQHVRPLTTTATSDLYLVDSNSGPAVLKSLNPIGVESEACGALALRYWNGAGAVKLFKSSDFAHLVEFADGPTLAEHLISEGDTSSNQVMCQVYSDLHCERLTPLPPLMGLEDYFESLFQRAKSESCDSQLQLGARIAHELLRYFPPEEASVLHGDLHHHNILHDSSRGWLAIDPKGVLGDPIFDLANAFFNPHTAPALVSSAERVQKMLFQFSTQLGLDRKRIAQAAYAYGCLSISWFLDDGSDSELSRSVLCHLGKHLC